jgi:hypothetical protein
MPASRQTGYRGHLPPDPDPDFAILAVGWLPAGWCLVCFLAGWRRLGLACRMWRAGRECTAGSGI